MPEITAYVTTSGARDVADFLARVIPTHCPLPNVTEWEEVRDALYALANDTDAIRTKDESESVCSVCYGKRYLVCRRSDGREAIEACDNCRDETTFSDVDAAMLATADGYVCEPIYPCIVHTKPA